MARKYTMQDWDTTCKRYVGYIDIMGFKDMVLRLSHEQVYEIMQKIYECKNDNENVKWSDIDEKLVSVTNYSDSLIVYSKDNSYESLDAFTNTISGIITDLFNEHIPFKGAVAFGTMTLDIERSIFFGQPLIDSYLLQDELYFYGVIVHATAEQEMRNFGSDIKDLFITQCVCPLKNGSSVHLTVHPMDADPTDNAEKNIKSFNELLLSVINLRMRTSGHLRKYIDNTIKYLKAVWEKNKMNNN